MAGVEFQDGAIQVDAEIIGRGLGLESALVRDLMRLGEITSLCERGEGVDAGRYRLTFYHKGRRLRLIVDESGCVLRQTLIDFGDRLLPGSMHRPAT
jgi:hypothetical protein